MIKQVVLRRTNNTTDLGTMGFHDYVTLHEELDKFIERVSIVMNQIQGEIISVSYPSVNIAIIAYREASI